VTGPDTGVGPGPILRTEAAAELPAWPLWAMVVLYPVWYVLGLNGFMWVVLATPMAASLVRRRGLRVPRGFGLYAVFLVWMLASVVQVDTASRLAGFVLRAGYYTAGAVVLLYVVNGGRSVSTERVISWFTALWGAAVVGGYLAFVFGSLSYRSPVGLLLPESLLENELIGALVTPGFADVQTILGFPLPRPKAPFTYTNSWGSAMALLTPFALAALADPRVPVPRLLVRIGLVASIVPIIVSLNRGLWLSLTVGMLWVAVRSGVHGRSRPLFTVSALSLAAAVLLVVTPLGALAADRLATPHSNEDRARLAADAWSGALESPVLGHGAPRPTEAGKPAVGTHGQLWLLLFSHGFVAASAYLAFLVALVWTGRRATTPSGWWLGSVALVALVQAPFYLHLPHQLFIVLAAAGVTVRSCAASEEPQRFAQPELVR
jgi:polysaccharide biosynthesis protein PslJ